MKTSETLKQLLVKTLGYSQEEVASLFTNEDGLEINDDAMASILERDQKRVERFQTERQTYFDNGFKKAQKETLTKFENDVREAFKIDSDKQGIDLINDIVTNKLGAGVELEEDKIKVHPLYVKTVDDFNRKVKDTEKIWQDKYNGRESEIVREKTFSTIKQKSKSIIDSLKPLLPKDATKAEKQMGFLYNELSGYEFDLQDETIIVKKDGKLYEDKHGQRIQFDDLIKGIASGIWDFEVGTPKKGSGNDNNDGAGAGAMNHKITSTKEFTDMVSKATTGEERIALKKSYETAKANGELKD